jgi:hypothetical protein
VSELAGAGTRGVDAHRTEANGRWGPVGGPVTT